MTKHYQRNTNYTVHRDGSKMCNPPDYTFKMCNPPDYAYDVQSCCLLILIQVLHFQDGTSTWNYDDEEFPILCNPPDYNARCIILLITQFTAKEILISFPKYAILLTICRDDSTSNSFQSG